jgi:hypothetical protein
MLMPSHMSTIGFPVKTNQDFDRLANQAVQFGETMEPPDGSYCVWSPGEGIELWAQHDPQGHLIGLNPHFSGKARMQVGLTRRVQRPRASALDGAFYGWAGAPEDEPASGEYPFVFGAPDYRAHDAWQLPKVVTAQLAAFAHNLTAVENEQAMCASGGWMSSMAPESCIPSGTFLPGGGTIDPPKAEVIFCGRVLETASLTKIETRMPPCFNRGMKGLPRLGLL